jgi:hypothetical protein
VQLAVTRKCSGDLLPPLPPREKAQAAIKTGGKPSAGSLAQNRKSATQIGALPHDDRFSCEPCTAPTDRCEQGDCRIDHFGQFAGLTQCAPRLKLRRGDTRSARHLLRRSPALPPGNGTFLAHETEIDGRRASSWRSSPPQGIPQDFCT